MKSKSAPRKISCTRLFDGKRFHNNKTVVIEDGVISEITAFKGKTGAEAFVTPGFIDAHSHIGMFRAGEPGSEQEGNETLNQILPLSDPLNSIYFDDQAFKDAIDFGVLYSCVIPGSGNLFGGKARVIRNFATNRSHALVKDYGYKMALGFNPRSTTDWKGERPNTRMGIYSMLEKRFLEVRAKATRADMEREKKLAELAQKVKKKELDKPAEKRQREFIQKEYELSYSAEDLAILEVIEGKFPVKVHVHKEDDCYYLIELAKRFGLKVTAEHTGDVFHLEVFNALADANIPVVFGPLGSHAYKVELAHSYYQSAALLMQSRAIYGLMTDHPVIHVTGLRDSLKYFLIQGMSAEDALALITSKNADILGIDCGVIAVGKPSSLLVWEKDPLHLSAFPKTVVAEGSMLREEGRALIPQVLRQ